MYLYSVNSMVKNVNNSVEFNKTLRPLMYCLRLILPLLILPKPSNPAAHLHHTIYILLFLISFFLERKPCGVCTVILLLFIFLPCFTFVDSLCLFSSCSTIYMS
ncbi:unnamed protein product [Schistocephalus solidus]|uniref:Bladder cancer-associated protein n=1 Tax=Schistocephalus solidus TaxID=70667 RepID=A0A3P7D610_SCHSO|nr:unnamed protein product [Schistocephalus solidus]